MCISHIVHSLSIPLSPSSSLTNYRIHTHILSPSLSPRISYHPIPVIIIYSKRVSHNKHYHFHSNTHTSIHELYRYIHPNSASLFITTPMAPIDTSTSTYQTNIPISQPLSSLIHYLLVSITKHRIYSYYCLQ